MATDPTDTDIVDLLWNGYAAGRESSYAGYLGLTRSQLRREVSDYFGYVEPYDRLNTLQQRQVDSAISRGLRQFYYPEPLRNESFSHSWSFLKPSVAFDLVADKNRYTLPMDFGGIEGDLHYETDADTKLRNVRVRVTSISEINEAERQQKWEGTGVPHLAAIEPRELIGSSSTSTRYVLRLYPTPDAVYSMRMRYNAFGPSVSVDGDDDHGTNRYLPGSAQHAETIVSSCLCIAEQIADSRNRNSRMQDQYQRRLAASIMLDRRGTAPESVGVMTDPANYRTNVYRPHRIGDVSSITYGGGS